VSSKWTKKFEKSLTLYSFYRSGGGKLPYLVTQAKVRRMVMPNKNGQRSKYVIRPDQVTMAGNHVVWKLINGKKNL
jgi:hypothetical protein